ncbi:MAG: DUF4416 family protein [Spirochaetales bacterium]|nr:DUF4416 family protein [Spirochaetales bacterium]
MAEIKAYTPEKLVIGILISDLTLLPFLRRDIQKTWGPVDLETEPEVFIFSDYYNREMGTPIYRLFCSLEKLVDPEDLASIKIHSNALEEIYVSEGGRKINLDPGILCQSKFILATTKNNAHRIPMSKGIYGELTLQYRQGQFRDLEWTYPDYREAGSKQFLMDVRKIYVGQLKDTGA